MATKILLGKLLSGISAQELQHRAQKKGRNFLLGFSRGVKCVYETLSWREPRRVTGHITLYTHGISESKYGYLDAWSGRTKNGRNFFWYYDFTTDCDLMILEEGEIESDALNFD